MLRGSKNTILWLGVLVMTFVHWQMRHLPSPVSSHDIPLLQAHKNAEDDAIAIDPYEEKNNRKVVQSSRVEEDESLNDQEAKHLGEHRNRVKKETQGLARGPFREGRGTPSTPVPSEKGEGIPAPQISDLMAFGSSPHDLGDEIAAGNQTVLNTDPVKYASFINRIANEIYEPWVVRAREAVRLIYGDGRKLEANTYITKLQIVMDATGEVRAIQTLRGSGVDELDEAPKQAFWDVEPFPHPPDQMFKKENMVRFIYEFHFEWQTSSFNIVPWTI